MRGEMTRAGKKVRLRKKSLVGWCYPEWRSDFFTDKMNPTFVHVPYILTAKRFDVGKAEGLPKRKVRITIEELH